MNGVTNYSILEEGFLSANMPSTLLWSYFWDPNARVQQNKINDYMFISISQAATCSLPLIHDELHLM